MKKISTITKLIVILLIVVLLIVFLTIGLCNGNTKTDKNVGVVSTVSKEYIAEALNYDDGSDPFRQTYLEYANSGLTSLVNINDIVFPEALTKNSEFGMHIYNGTKFVPYYENQNFFDTNKKTIFYAHGMGSGGYFFTPENFADDYNIVCINWGAFSGEEGLSFSEIAKKAWYYDGNFRYYSRDRREWINENIGYSVVEVYAAFYFDILTSHKGYDKEITITGHSYGGMLSYGLLSYLVSAYRNGLITPDLLPQNVTLFDPFLMAVTQTSSDKNDYLHIRWLGNMPDFINVGGAVAVAKQAIIDARLIGISVGLIRTSFWIEYPLILSIDPSNFLVAPNTQKFNAQLFYVDGDALVLFGDTELSPAHEYGRCWPVLMTEEFYDSEYPDEYGFSLLNPYHSKFTRMGTKYTLTYNGTPDDLSDDKITLNNPNFHKIYGFVYKDNNNNGILDENIAFHYCGANVEIKNSANEVVYETKTSINGYFEYYVKDTGDYTVTIKAKGFDDIVISVSVNENTHFAYANGALK